MGCDANDVCEPCEPTYQVQTYADSLLSPLLSLVVSLTSTFAPSIILSLIWQACRAWVFLCPIKKNPYVLKVQHNDLTRQVLSASSGSPRLFHVWRSTCHPVASSFSACLDEAALAKLSRSCRAATKSAVMTQALPSFLFDISQSTNRLDSKIRSWYRGDVQ